MKCRKHTKYIFLVIAVVAASLFAAAPVLADPDDLVVEFENTPLFSGANFLPGDGIERYVRVTNNTGESKNIAVEAINITDLEDFGDVLHMLIKEDSTTHFDDTLSAFFAAGEISLSEVGSGGSTTQYDFTVTFDGGAGDVHQGKSLGFDILIGFQGESGGGGSSTGGNGGGGGGSGGSALLPGLVIRDEATIETAETAVTITWITSFFATSQVLYAKENEAHALDLSDNAGSPPTYGYAHTTPETDVSPKVTSHSVTITGLEPGTAYFYRAVSRASPPTIGREHTFTTLTLVEQEKKEPEQGAPEEPGAGETGAKPPIPGELGGGAPEGEIEGQGQEQGPTGITREEESPPLDLDKEQLENGELPEELAALLGEEEAQEERFTGSALAAVGGIFKELGRSYFLLALFIIGIAALFVIGSREWRRRKERK